MNILCDVFQPYISPMSVQKFIFYELNIQPHIHISLSKHETIYLIYYDQSRSPIFTTHEARTNPSI